jgi:DNA-binding protein Fis
LARRKPGLKVIPAVETELVRSSAWWKPTGTRSRLPAKLLGIPRATLRKRVREVKIKRELAIK